MANVLAVIPARGGSKGVLRKNLRTVGGITLIAHAIHSAKLAKNISRCVVSTDDDEIASVALEAGGDVPFIRPTELATDIASSIDVLIHAHDFCEQIDEITYDIVVLLQPTTPFRSGKDIDATIRLLKDHPERESAVSVAPAETCNPHYLYRYQSDNTGITPLLADNSIGKRRQDLEQYYIRTGAVYAVMSSYLTKQHRVVGPNSLAYVMDTDRSINIDSELELFIANQIWSYYHMKP